MRALLDFDGRAEGYRRKANPPAGAYNPTADTRWLVNPYALNARLTWLFSEVRQLAEPPLPPASTPGCALLWD